MIPPIGTLGSEGEEEWCVWDEQHYQGVSQESLSKDLGPCGWMTKAKSWTLLGSSSPCYLLTAGWELCEDAGLAGWLAGWIFIPHF